MTQLFLDRSVTKWFQMDQIKNSFTTDANPDRSHLIHSKPPLQEPSSVWYISGGVTCESLLLCSYVAALLDTFDSGYKLAQPKWEDIVTKCTAKLIPIRWQPSSCQNLAMLFTSSIILLMSNSHQHTKPCSVLLLYKHQNNWCPHLPTAQGTQCLAARELGSARTYSVYPDTPSPLSGLLWQCSRQFSRVRPECFDFD